MTNTEINYQIKDIDMRIEGVIQWIKYHYSVYKPEQSSAIDVRSLELSHRLQQYHYLQTQKTRLMSMYGEKQL